MKKIYIFCMIALVTMCGLNSCSDDCDHEFIEVDYSKALVGTWTCIDSQNEFGEALVIKEDGSVEVTGASGGEYYETKGTIKVVNNKMTYILDNGKKFEGLFEIAPGKSFSMVAGDELDMRLTYQYCENDLSDEILGMWVVVNTSNMTFETFNEDGSASTTGIVGEDMILKSVSNYKVIGDLFIHSIDVEGETKYTSYRLIYSPGATSNGDTMTWQLNDIFHFSRLHIKQELNLEGRTYDYSTAYVTNAEGTDEDFVIAGKTFNMANLNARDFDAMFRSVLSCLEFGADSFKYKYLLNDGQEGEFDTPITVEGNKVTLDMSAVNPACRKVDMYMFQDVDDSLLHIYMHTKSFINYFANLNIIAWGIEGKLDPTDTAAVEKVFADMESRIESINVSFIFKERW